MRNQENLRQAFWKGRAGTTALNLNIKGSFAVTKLFLAYICEAFNMAPTNQPPRSTASTTPAPKIAKKKKGVRSNVKLHVVFDDSVGEPRGCNCHKFFRAIGYIVSRYAPRNVRKWDDIPEEKIQSLIDRVLSMFDVDISKSYVKDWILWRMKLRFRCIMEEKAKNKVQNAEVMELMSKLAIGSFDMDLEVDSTCTRG
ncbi:hypothetical protein LWI28_014166 [Acer negundo]|uniref:Uncharacterized protein n=1 Tax=Acer negundo TaxID=4023 RepID=A0AAD5JDD5_ACENE|nr:hypothetical protein LWI28_014166 [Acer negundo]